MRYFWSKLSSPIRSLLLFALIFGAAFLVLLYYLGYYDFSFLDRYKDQLDLLRDGEQLSSSDDPFGSVPDVLLINPASDPAGSAAADSSAAAAAENAPNGASPADAPQTGTAEEKEAPTNLRYVYDTSELPDARIRIPTTDTLLSEGKKYSSQEALFVPGKNVLGKLTFDFQLPETYTETWRHATAYRLTPTDPGNVDSDYVTKPYTYIQARPTVDVYMGYLFIENGDKIVVVSADGELLCSYPTGRYEPA